MRWLACLVLLFGSTAQADWQRSQWDVMGTRATLEFWRDTPAVAHNGIDPVEQSIRDEFARINQLLSPWIADSELAQVNDRAAQHAVTISTEFMQLLQRSKYYYRLTNGAFDASFASAGALYDYRAAHQPDDAQLEKARACIGFDFVRLEQDSVRFTCNGVRLDLGGIAKGYAIDRAVSLLREQGISHAYVSLGGDSYVLGDRQGRPWQVGIRHPRDASAVAMRVPVSDIAVSTSGDYERFFIADGERVHHIINPSTGKSSQGLVSVTILAPQGMDADALSTSVFVMGRKRGLELINRLDNVSAIIIDDAGGVHYSDDLVSPEDAGDR
ncbi:MAG: FAD:protein FMN transferase [Alcanivoracaceae bacterium]|nr:FAD:protein FMN transferase [Alcanivoracaceae bacterium]